jgi:hypothetical protein
MSKLTDVRVGLSLLRDNNLNDNRPAWWVIAVGIFFFMYLCIH